MNIGQKIIWTIYLAIMIIVIARWLQVPYYPICLSSIGDYSTPNLGCQLGIAAILIMVIGLIFSIPAFILNWIWKDKKKK